MNFSRTVLSYGLGLLLALFCNISSTHAANEVSIQRVYLGTLTGGTFSVQDGKYNYMQQTPGFSSVFTDRHVEGRVLLGVDPLRLDATTANAVSTVTFDLFLTKHNGTSFYQEVISGITLSVDYGATDDYTSEDYFRFRDAYEARVVITSSSGVSEEAIYMESRIESERYYSYAIQTIPPADSIFQSVADNRLSLKWPFIEGAEAYDFEWCYVDRTNNPSPTSAINYSFDENTSRVRVSANRFSLPLIYNRGTLLFRYRPVYYDPSDYTTSVEGRWSTDQVGLGASGVLASYMALGSGSMAPWYDITQVFDAERNWSASAVYAEEGKAVYSVNYSDGLGRSRQSQVSNEATGQVIASSAIYDSEGRPSVSILPSPVDVRDFRFLDSLNIPADLSDDAYTYNHFELDTYLDTAGACAYNFVKLSDTESKGAAYYFSDKNMYKEGAQAFVPDADSVPMMITRYAPDNTGRIRESAGGFGDEFQPLGSHAVSFMYDQPGNGDLADYFEADDRGESDYYKRKHVIDQNSQRSTVYQNTNGQVVLSILSGTPPTNLDSLSGSMVTAPRVVDLTEFNTWEDDAYVSRYQRVVDPGRTYDFSYDIDIPKYNATCDPSINLCFDCVYDIELIITVENPCVPSIYDTLKHDVLRAGEFKAAIDSCSLDTLYQLNGGAPFSIVPNIVKPTTMYITKRAILNDSAVQAFADFYMDKSGCVPNAEDLFMNAFRDVFAQADSCSPDYCQVACEESVGSFYSFMTNNYGTQQVVITTQVCDTATYFYQIQHDHNGTGQPYFYTVDFLGNGTYLPFGYDFINTNQLAGLFNGTLTQAQALGLFKAHYDVLYSYSFSATDAAFISWFGFSGNIGECPEANIKDTIFTYDTAAAQVAYTNAMQQCYSLCAREIDLLPTRCERLEQRLIEQFIPGGFYAHFDSTFSSDVDYSIFNDANIFGAASFDYTNSNIAYLKGDGSPYTNTAQGPWNMSKQAFISGFEPQWAEAIYAYLKTTGELPDQALCYLSACSTNADVFAYEALLRSINSYDQAVKIYTGTSDSAMVLQPSSTFGSSTTHYTVPGGGIAGDVLHDPFEGTTTLLKASLQGNQTGGIDLYSMAYRIARKATTGGPKIGQDDCFKDREWRTFRDLYLARRLELVDSLLYSCSPTDTIPFLWHDIMTEDFGLADSLAGDMGNSTGRQNFYTNNLSRCESNCDSLAKHSWSYMLDETACGMSLATKDAVLADMVTLCQASCNQNNPMGATSLPSTPDTTFMNGTHNVNIVPTFITITPCGTAVNVSSFDDILAAYAACSALSLSLDCNAYKIESVGSFNETIPYPVLDDCGCSKVQGVRTEFDSLQAAGALPPGITQPDAYFAQVYGVWLHSYTEAECACNAYSGATLEAQMIPMPQGFSCQECIPCNNLLTEYTNFYNEVMGTTTYSLGGDTTDVLFELFSNYLKLNKRPIQASSGDLASYVKECEMVRLNQRNPYGLSPYAGDLLEFLNYMREETSFQNGNTHALPIYHEYYRNTLYPHAFDTNISVQAAVTSTSNSINIQLTQLLGNPVNNSINITNIQPTSLSPDSLLFFTNIYADIGTVTTTGDVYNFQLTGVTVTGDTFLLTGSSSFPIYSTITSVSGSVRTAEICPERYNGIKQDNPCLDLAVNNAMNAVTSALALNLDSIRQAFIDDYKGQCALINENYSMSYLANEYSATLYYYTVDGNLVQTISPRGVDVGNPTGHTFRTKYHYNTLNQLVQSESPDGGRTKYWYNRKGQLVLSQNAEQRQIVNVNGWDYQLYSFTTYDAYGRIKQVGQFKARVSKPTPHLSGVSLDHFTEAFQDDVINAPGFPFSAAIDFTGYPGFNAWLTADFEQVTYTHYTNSLTPEINAYFNGERRFLKGRVSSVTYEEKDDNDSTTYDYAIHFGYDIHGNVRHLINENTHLKAFNLHLKEVEYDYDLLSGNVNEVRYQAGRNDAKYHKYQYDANNRLEKVYTSQDDVVWEEDASYEYYLHGPLARTELGEQHVQGLDYVYNLQGWIKAMNSNTLQEAYDPGKDGQSGTGYYSTKPHLHREIARDAFGYVVDYYQGDYKAIDGSKQNFAATHGGSYSYTSGLTGLYNGNIAGYSPAITKEDNTLLASNSRAYRYDQLNRLKTQVTHQNANLGATNNHSATTATTDYGVSISYDVNGNITDLVRTAYLDGGFNNMDNMTYNYSTGNNQLTSVLDTDGQQYNTDIDASVTGSTFTYNSIGQLISNSEDEIDTIHWNVYGKVTEIIRKPSSTFSDLEFRYDPFGNRILKIEKPRDGTGVEPMANWKFTEYANDASGNNLAIYDITAAKGVSTYNFTLDEIVCEGTVEISVSLEDDNFPGLAYGTEIECGDAESLYSAIQSIFEGWGLTVIRNGSSFSLILPNGELWVNPTLQICIGRTCYVIGGTISTGKNTMSYAVAERSHYGSGRLGIDTKYDTLTTAEFDNFGQDMRNWAPTKTRVYLTGSELELRFLGDANFGYGADFKLYGDNQLLGQYNGYTLQGLADTLSIVVFPSAWYDSVQVSSNPIIVRYTPKNYSHVYKQYHIEYVSSPTLQISMRRPAKLEGFHKQNHTMGETHYELANYLGNVHNVVSNRVLFETNIQYQEDFESYPACGMPPTFTTWIWSLGGQICGGKARQGGANAYMQKGLTLTPNQTYSMQFDLTSSTGNVTVNIYEGSPQTITHTQSFPTGTHTLHFAPTSSAVTISFESGATATNYTIDNIVVQDSGRGTILAEVMQYQDYYPYGMIMPGRNGSNAQSTLYRYGMNGMERMDETSGNGNAYTTFFRQYDARLGRWFSTDPVVHAYLSPYNAFDGNPIYFADPRGDDSEGANEGTKTVKIEEGQTLTGIAKEHNSTVDQLLELNPSIEDKNKIYAGADLVVPESSTNQKENKLQSLNTSEETIKVTSEKVANRIILSEKEKRFYTNDQNDNDSRNNEPPIIGNRIIFESDILTEIIPNDLDLGVVTYRMFESKYVGGEPGMIGNSDVIIPVNEKDPIQRSLSTNNNLPISVSGTSGMIDGGTYSIEMNNIYTDETVAVGVGSNGLSFTYSRPSGFGVTTSISYTWKPSRFYMDALLRTIAPLKIPKSPALSY